MRNEINIKSLLDAVTVPADWVGIREVYAVSYTHLTLPTILLV